MAKRFLYSQPLTAVFVRTIKRPGKYYDGRLGLYLKVTVRGTKVRRYWEVRFTFNRPLSANIVETAATLGISGGRLR